MSWFKKHEKTENQATLPPVDFCPLCTHLPQRKENVICITSKGVRVSEVSFSCDHHSTKSFHLHRVSEADAISLWNQWCTRVREYMDEPTMTCPECHRLPQIVGDPPRLECYCACKKASDLSRFMEYALDHSAPEIKHKWNERCREILKKRATYRRQVRELEDTTGIEATV